jgi:hypothetical protein
VSSHCFWTLSVREHYLTGDATPQQVSVLEIKVSPANFKISIATRIRRRNPGSAILPAHRHREFKVAVPPLTAGSAKLAADRMFLFVRYAKKRTPQTASRLGRYLTVAIGPFYLVAGKDFK